MATRRDYQGGSDNSSWNFPSPFIDQVHQTITPSDTYLLDYVRFSASKYQLNPGTCYVSIYETSGGYPTGAPISSRESFACPDSKTFLLITFSSQPTLVAGVTYAIFFEAPGGISEERSLLLFGSGSSGAHYPDGDRIWKDSGYLGSIWHTETTQDLFFECWGDDPPPLSPPIKAENPTPANSATAVDFSALGLSWDDGGGADTFNVYMGPVGALVLVSSAQVGTTLTVDTSDVPWGETIYWRINSTNDAGTTIGDTWSFDIVVIRSVKLGANGAFIVVTAKDGVYLSTDSGANWSRETPDTVEDTDWVKGICSSDGTYIIVVSNADAIYRSANSGSSWTQITPAGGDTFSVNKMATSDDGQFMVIVGQNSTDVTESCYISIDYGATWTAKKPVAASIEYTDCDISNDGTVIAISTSTYFYISFDSGTAWMEQGMASTAEVWEGLSISGDGITGLVANTNDNDEFFIGINTELYSKATWAESTITSAGRALIDDATVADQNTTLGFGIGDSPTLTGLTLFGIVINEVGSLANPAIKGKIVHLATDNLLYFGKEV